MQATMRDVARSAHVSANTVSKALGNRSGVSKDTRERILHIAEDLDYLPNALGRNLKLRCTKAIGVIISDNANPFFAHIIKGIQHAARERGYYTVLHNTDENADFEEEGVDLLLELRVAGFLIVPTQKRIDYILKLKRLQIPFVLLSRDFEEVTTNYVGTDDVMGGYIATQHLINRGHRKIVFVNGPYQNSAAKDRFRGYQMALEENKVLFNESLVEWGNLDIEDGHSAMKRILAKERPPLGVFSFSDYVAVGVMRAVREKNMSVPEDVSIVGYDDIDFSNCLEVPLTTVRQPRLTIGKRAAEILINIIERRLPNEGRFQRFLFQPKLVLRSSG